MGSIFGGGTSTTTTNSSSAPWSPQQPYLTSGFNQAQSAYNNGMNTGPYSGQFVAGTNPYMTSAEQGANGYATGYGASMPNTIAAVLQRALAADLAAVADA